VHRDGPEPEAIFSPDQWTEIAKAISRLEIPAKDQHDICSALMAYHFARVNNERAAEEDTRKSTRRKVDPRAKGAEALKQFIQYARGLRGAINSVEWFLVKDELIDKAEQLIEDIYQLQQFAEGELKIRSIGGRPTQASREYLVRCLGRIYERLTGEKPGRSRDPETGNPSGPFVRFISTIFDLQKIPLKGIKHVIARVARDAKNRR
jgi:hypothetical protein